MKLFDTALARVTEWTPPQHVRIYVCGITPYDSAHLGHIFTFMTYDLLQRYLEDQGHTVTMVRNVTDVDEPIFRKAAELNVPYNELAQTETAMFRSVLNRLNFRSASHEPLASEYIEQMAVAVSQLLESGIAYSVDADIYFDTSRDPLFGSFSGFDQRLQLGLMKLRGGDPGRPGKRQPLDFLLWRSITDPADPAAWTTTAAPAVPHGRPGWHIECSVMSSELLGKDGSAFELHGGGSDLIYPHHECEVAQTRALRPNQPELAERWMHVAPINFHGEKMSKSLGNLVFAEDLLEAYEPSVIRLALMDYHFRIGGEWVPEMLDRASELLTDIRRTVASGAVNSEAADGFGRLVRESLADNLDTHAIIHGLHCLRDSCSRASSPLQADGTAALMTSFELLGLRL